MPDLGTIRAEKARRHLIDFTKYTFPSYQIGWVHREIAARLDRFLIDVEQRRSPRVMLFVPPRHGKSELASRRMPAFALGRNPNLSLIATSYGGDLASDMNRSVQRIMSSEEYAALFPSVRLPGTNGRRGVEREYVRTSDMFEVVGSRGVYRSAGVGGGITGRGAEILTIDDPIKDMEQALSRVYREKVWDWFVSTAYTRLAPGGGVLIILTRWHEDDLAGRLLRAAEEGGEQWEVVRFAAIAEHDEEFRKEGEALAPSRYTLPQLENIRGVVGSRVWEALYQQHPSPAEGTMFKESWWRFWRYAWQDDVPGLEERTSIIQEDQLKDYALSWDCSFKDTKSSDFVAAGVWAKSGADRYLMALDWRRMDFPETLRAFRKQVEDWPQARVKLVEDTANGPAVITTLKHEIQGIIPVKPEGGKEARAAATSPQVEAGNVYLPLHAPWRDRYIEEHKSFPLGPHDDAVDQQSQMLLRWTIQKKTPLQRLKASVRM